MTCVFTIRLTMLGDGWDVPGRVGGTPMTIKDFSRKKIGCFVFSHIVLVDRKWLWEHSESNLDHCGASFIVEDATHQQSGPHFSSLSFFSFVKWFPG